MVMTRFVGCLVTLCALAGCVATSTYMPKDAPASVGAPQVKVGDFWEYTVRDGYTGLPRGIYRYEVSRVDGERVVVDVNHDGRRIDTFIYAAGWNGLELPLTNLQRFRYEPALPAFAYPLKPGQTWYTVVNATDPATRRTYRVHTKGRVVGWERIKIPAGEFDALRIQRYVYAGNVENFKLQEEIDETDWYVPSVRRSVRSQASSEHLDTSRGGGGGDEGGGGSYPLLVRGDWLIAELVSYSR